LCNVWSFRLAMSGMIFTALALVPDSTQTNVSRFA
jgi:hypothetical protein